MLLLFPFFALIFAPLFFHHMGLYRGYIKITQKNMEITIQGLGSGCCSYYLLDLLSAGCWRVAKKYLLDVPGRLRLRLRKVQRTWKAHDDVVPLQEGICWGHTGIMKK